MVDDETIAHPHRVAHLLIPGGWPERKDSRDLTQVQKRVIDAADGR
jgi:hypothetical protein